MTSSSKNDFAQDKAIHKNTPAPSKTLPKSAPKDDTPVDIILTTAEIIDFSEGADS